MRKFLLLTAAVFAIGGPTAAPAQASATDEIVAMLSIYFIKCDSSIFSQGLLRFMDTYTRAHQNAVMAILRAEVDDVRKMDLTENAAWKLWCASQEPSITDGVKKFGQLYPR
jgi:hypothetical protein